MNTCYFAGNHNQTQRAFFLLENPTESFELSCHGNSKHNHVQSPMCHKRLADINHQFVYLKFKRTDE